MKQQLIIKYFFQNSHLYFQIWLKSGAAELEFLQEYANNQDFRKGLSEWNEKLEQNLPIMSSATPPYQYFGKVA
jgi:cyclopropane fatty-acyl-phospholipid synthase-like methyltransferase